MIQSESNIYFREESIFWNTWLKYILLSFTLIPIIVTVFELNKQNTSTDDIIGLVVLNFIFFATFVLILFVLKLEIMINDEGIKFRYFPFHIKYKVLKFTEISSYKIVKYTAIREYGGWGIRYSFRQGWAYTVSGNMGIQISKSDGKRVLFGTYREKEFFAELDKKIKSINKDN